MPTSQTCSQLPSNSSDVHPSCLKTHDKANHISHTAIGLVAAFVLFFIIVFLVLNLKYRRRSSQGREELPFNMKDAMSRKPKLWEVSLDNPASRWTAIDPVRDLQPVAAWTYEDGLLPPVNHVPAMDDDDLAMAQVWCDDDDRVATKRSIPLVFRPPPTRLVADRRTLNVAVLVAMPSPHLAKHRPETGPHLSFGEGQLMLGVACLPCKEQVILTALGNPKQTT